MKILTINAGSSSLRYQLMEPEGGAVLARGLCQRIGMDGHLTQICGGVTLDADILMPTHSEAIQAALGALVSPDYGAVQSLAEIDAVGHRVVHGGTAFAESCIIDGACLAAIEACIPLAPLHNPANLTCIRACQKAMPGAPMVAVFDTAFHQTMPPRAYLYPIPYEYYRRDQVRRYGFHGISHRYVSRRAAQLLGRPVSALKMVTCHLGNGVSLAAVDGGRSVDTSMGMGPLAGCAMGTRAGDVDATILGYLMERRGYSMAEMMEILSRRSGVLGVSGVSSDFRDIAAAARAGNHRAALALDLFCYQVKKGIGAYAAAMGGMDAIVFTGGIGENSTQIRQGVLSGLAFLGVDLDDAANRSAAEGIISAPGSRVSVLVIPADEERLIAGDTAEVIRRT